MKTQMTLSHIRVCAAMTIIFLANSLRASSEPSVWFGACTGMNGIAIVPHEVNRKLVVIAPGINPTVTAHLYYDATGFLDVTDVASWTGTVRVVRHGPYHGMLLAHGTGSNWLGVAHLTFADSIPVMVSSPNDADNDGMLDVWELAHGFSTNDDTDASADANTNGVSNLDEFLNGTDPCEPREVFAFPPLHRYPYSNGFYCAPDVPLEWFASSTLGRYQVEVAVWPACDTLVYRAEVWDTNAIGDAVVHTADLAAGAGTQCAFRVRAAFTNETGWTAWSGWRPFTVLEPMADHTLRLANGQPLRGMYFFFWNQSHWISNWFANTNGWLAATNTYWWPFDWKNCDAPCVSDLFLIGQLDYNTLMLDQQTFRLLGEPLQVGRPFEFLTNIAIPGSTIYRGFNLVSNYDSTNFVYIVSTNYLYWNTNYWSPQVERDNRLTHGGGLCELPWLSYASAIGGIGLHPSFDYYEELNEYIGLRYAGQPLTGSNALYQLKVRLGPTNYSLFRCSNNNAPFFPNLHHPLLRDTWAGIINEYVWRHLYDSNTTDNALLSAQHRGRIVPVVAPVVELFCSHARDFSDTAIADFRLWLQHRYGAVGHLNNEWNCSLSSWAQVDPVAQDGSLFQWEWRSGDQPRTNIYWDGGQIATNIDYAYRYVRACDDFDEFSIERYCAAWRAVRESVQHTRPVLFAAEVWGQAYYARDEHGIPQTTAPLHRIVDWADIVIQRKGYVIDTDRQRQAYAEMYKSGKYVVLAVPSDISWTNPGPQYTLQYLAEQSLENSPNTAALWYNELEWRTDSLAYLNTFMYNLSSSNDYRRFSAWAESRDVGRLANWSGESGVGRYIPNWTCQPLDRISVASSRSFAGAKSVRITGGVNSAQFSSSAFVPTHSNIYVLMYAKVESELPNASVALEVTLGSESCGTFIYEAPVWSNDIAQERWNAFAVANGMETWPLNECGASNGLESQWCPLLYACGTVNTGTALVLSLRAIVPPGVTLVLDGINAMDLP